MRIGLIAPPWIPVPPPAYGGTEEVIHNLARGLQALGHDVRLFTVGESTCPVPRRWLYRSPAEPMGDQFQESAHALAAYEALADTDISPGGPPAARELTRDYQRPPGGLAPDLQRRHRNRFHPPAASPRSASPGLTATRGYTGDDPGVRYRDCLADGRG